MTEQPVTVAEMAIRHVLQALWFAALAAICAYLSWPFLEWGLAGFPKAGVPEPGMLFLQGFLALLALGWTLRAGELVFFRIVPWALARLFQGGSAKIDRKR